MKKIILILSLLMSFAAYAQTAKVAEPVNNTTSQPVGGMDSARNPKTFLVDPSGALIISGSIGGSIAPSSSFKDYGVDAVGVVAATPKAVVSFSCLNTNVSDRFILLHDKATAPILAEVPVVSFYVPAGAQIVIGDDFFSSNGLPLASGVAYCFSTTPRTCTPAAGTDKDLQVIYK